MTREVSRENSQDALDKDPRAVRPDQPTNRDEEVDGLNAEIEKLRRKLDEID